MTSNEDSILIHKEDQTSVELQQFSADTERGALNVQEIKTKKEKKDKKNKKDKKDKKEKGDKKSKKKDAPSNASVLTKLFMFTKRQMRDVIIANVCLVIVSLGQSAIPYLCGRILDAINDPNSQELTNQLCLIFLVIVLSNTVFMFFKAYISSMAGERIICDLRSELFQNIMSKDIEFFEQRKSGEILSRMSSDTTMVQSASNNKISHTVKNTVTLLVSFYLLFTISFKLTISFVIILPFTIAAINKYSRHLKKISKKYQALLGESTVVAVEAISNVRVVKSFSTEEKEEKHYRVKMEETFSIGRKKALWNGVFTAVTSIMGNGAILFVLWYGGKMVYDEEMTPGQLASFVLYTISIASAGMNLSDTVNKIVSATAACERIFEIFDHKPTINSHGGARLDSKEWAIEFKNVDFKYSGKEDVYVFKNLNLKIQPGEKVALVGASGSGKSSLVALIERFYDVTNGEILINDHNLKDIDLRCLHSNIGYVSQEPLLFSGSVEENVTYGCVSYKTSDVDEALKQANAYEFIYDKTMFPQGLKTILGEKGVRLSGGQKQRIAIARALMINPKVLIFDEATSALDAESEAQVQQAIDTLAFKLQSTVIIIAHRLSTIVNCPRILVMQNGKVIEEGNHKELMNTKGAYRSLIERQVQGLIVA
jgi:ABC-type multidrug transport system fused ATPase/permease subunit